MNAKEKTQYTTAVCTLFSGIVLCFLSFFLNQYTIKDSVLMYFGQTLVFAGAVFGLNLMIKNKVIDMKAEIIDQINNIMQEKENSITDEEG